MPRLPEKLLCLFALAAVAAGCKPKIGDECQLSADCSAAGDRLCDITAPGGGYCTIYNCEPDTCPEDESLCVEFGAQRSSVEDCQSQQSPSPYARAFCMATCESDDDCRAGYRCVDLGKPTNRSRWDAVLIDTDRGRRACLADQAASTDTGNSQGGVCKYEPDGSGGAPSMSEGSGGAGGESLTSAGASGAASAAGGEPGEGAGGAGAGQGGAGG